MKQRHFWDQTYLRSTSESDASSIQLSPSAIGFHNHVNNVNGMRILDIGCGSGELSLELARKGAFVIGVDGSSAAVSLARENASRCGLDSQAVFEETDVFELSEKWNRPFDLVVGKFILHHIEPFADFVPILRNLLVPDGRAVFWENCGNNPLLRFARKYLVGRFGIPKFGDSDEEPFRDAEVELLRSHFQVRQEFPEFVFLSLASTYLLRSAGLPDWVRKAPSAADGMLLGMCPPIRRWSYRQLLVLEPK